MDKIPLANMLIELRKELDQAQREGDGKSLRFRIQAIDLELRVTASESDEGGAGFKFWIINGNAKGKVAAESLQKLHLTLNPIAFGEAGKERPLDIADDARIGD